MPDEFLRKVASEKKIKLPAIGKYGVGMMFLPQDPIMRKAIENIVEKIVVDENQKFLGWRDVPVDPGVPGEGAKITQPFIRQCFIGANKSIGSQDEFERKLYLVRRIIDHRVRAELKCDRSKYYVPSFSSKVLVYKGMLLAPQVTDFYKDLSDKDMKSAMAMIHLRFSTNTFPTWDLAHPFRMIAHNGEINTLRGNKNWMAARQAVMESPYFGKDLKECFQLLWKGRAIPQHLILFLNCLLCAGEACLMP